MRDLQGGVCRGPVEADAQTTRIAVLLDEMMIEEDGEAGVATGDNEEALDNGSGHILVEVLHCNLSLPNTRCSSRGRMLLPLANCDHLVSLSTCQTV